MCVIACCSIERPTKSQIESMWDSNHYGGGVAWREVQSDGSTLVRWEKGFDEVEPMIKLAEELPLPYVLHFRIPTYGGTIRQLTHPFVIEEDSRLDLVGTTPEGVLFHNGSWNSWRSELKIAAIQGKWHLPRGHYSDSRAMAIMAAHMGPGILELIEEKICVLTPTRLDCFGHGWTVHEKILYSNLGWNSRTKGGSCDSGTFQQRGTMWLAQWRGGHSTGQGGRDSQLGGRNEWRTRESVRVLYRASSVDGWVLKCRRWPHCGGPFRGSRTDTESPASTEEEAGALLHKQGTDLGGGNLSVGERRTLKEWALNLCHSVNPKVPSRVIALPNEEKESIETQADRIRTRWQQARDCGLVRR
jgi:hypothetical protein